MATSQVIQIKQYLQSKFKDKKFLSIFLLIFFGSLSWSLTMVKSGLVYDFGMGFWGPNGHDGVWHIALSKSLASGSWEMPMFAGEQIKNYHVGFDLILAILHKLTLIPIHTLYFQIIPPVLAVLIGIYVYKFIVLWQEDKAKAYWGTFFVYFGGGFGWLVTLLRDGNIGGESMFWSQQSVSTLINPPFAFSILIIFVGLNYLLKGLKSRSKRKRDLIVATFLFGILIQIKVYAGLLCLGALFISGFWRMLKRKGVSLVKVFSGALIISILLSSSLLDGASKTIVFKPFWFLETMMSFADRFNWPKFGEAMVNYKLGGVLLKGMIAYSVAFSIFIIGNLGTRIIGGFWIIKKFRNIKQNSYIDIFMISVIIVGIAIPMFFVQSGTPWNTIQFFYYSLIFSGILAGISFVDFARKFRGKKFVIYALEILLIMITIPTIIATLKNHYLPSRPPAKISSEEFEALEFLSKQSDGAVLTMPFDKDAADAAVDSPPRPLYLYESTAYVSAFSGKKVYLEDEVNLEITGYDWRGRRRDVEQFVGISKQVKARTFLRENNIKYIYWIENGQMEELKNFLMVERIFSNNQVSIYKVI